MRRSILRRWHARTGLAVLLVIVSAVFAATASAGRTSVLTAAPYSPACGAGTSFLDSLAARGGGARGEGREPNLKQVLEEVPADDPCYFEFTAGQAERMQEQYLFFRA